MQVSRLLLPLCSIFLALACSSEPGLDAPGTGGAGSGGTNGTGASSGVPSAGGNAPGCGSGQLACGAACVDVSSSVQHCGSCGTTCDTGERCNAGTCACLPGLTTCAGACTDTASDPDHCGTGCQPCAAGQVCSIGACKVGCDAGLVQCGSSCVELATNVQHCGACGATCGAGQTCAGGTCTCTAGQTRCGDGCVDARTDADHCGSCDNRCASGVCSGGTCTTGGSGGGAGTGGSGGSAGGAGASGGNGGAGGTIGGGGRRLIGGTCYAVCASAASDPDGDGWGWENQASCVVQGSAPYNGGTPCGGSGGTGGSGGSAGSGGGSGGSSGSGGSGGSGGTAGGCGVAPVNPSSIPAVRNVLCYLHQINKQSTLSGVQDCHWSSTPDLTYIRNVTGVSPAVVGGDFLYTNAVSQATSAWTAGSLSMIRYHMGRPEDADSYESSMGTTDLNATLTAGSSRYNGLMAKIDFAANRLLELQRAGVVVLWAPFHEAQPNGWFWWSKGSGTQYRQLWNLMFERFRTRGVNNVIWMMPFSGSPSSSFYPGKNVVDISGSDTYGDGQPFAGNYRNTVTAVGSSTLPLALHETGYVPNPTDMFANGQAPWVLFSVWCTSDWLQNTSRNSAAELRQAFVNPRTINRGGMPRF